MISAGWLPINLPIVTTSDLLGFGQQHALILFGFNVHEPYCRTTHRFVYSLRITGVIFLTLDEQAYILHWHHVHQVTQPG